LNIYKNILIVIYLSFCIGAYCQKYSEKDSVIIAIESANIQYLEKYIEYNDIDSVITSENLNPLHYSFSIRNYKIARWLLNNGASINYLCNDMTLLMNASKNSNLTELKLIYNYKPKINQYNSKRNTALIFAARYSNLEIVKFLIERGADPYFKNFTQKTALDYALDVYKSDIVNYLQESLVSFKEDFLPDFIDGPHVRLFNKKIKVEYFINDSLSNSLKSIKQTIRETDGKKLVLKPLFDTTQIITINRKNERLDFNFVSSDTIVVVGDIHGEYQILCSLLHNNNIVDSALNWIYGKGHIVFIGDVFDRGDNVTECLWLIYKLEEQAKLAGGGVHYILGNHELMVLTGDLRYIGSKYKAIDKRLKKLRSDFYQSNYLLGDWLRKKNTMEIIGDYLFVHAGVSDSLINKKLTINEVNNAVYSFLNNTKPVLTQHEALTLKLILTEFGPFWYRGFLKSGVYYNRMTSDQFENVCKYFNVKHIVFGHTIVRSIEPFYNNMAIPIDIEMQKSADRAHILMIEGDKMFRGYVNGDRSLITK